MPIDYILPPKPPQRNVRIVLQLQQQQCLERASNADASIKERREVRQRSKIDQESRESWKKKPKERGKVIQIVVYKDLCFGS